MEYNALVILEDKSWYCFCVPVSYDVALAFKKGYKGKGKVYIVVV